MHEYRISSQFPFSGNTSNAWHACSINATAIHYLPPLGLGLGLALALLFGLSALPLGPDVGRGLDQFLLGDATLDRLQHAVNDADVVAVGLVVTEPVEAPPPLLVHVGLDDALIQGIVQGLELLPLLLGHVEVAVVSVVVLTAVEHQELDLRDALVVEVGLRHALGQVLLVGLDEVEVELPAEVDRVLLGGLPLEDVGVGTVLVLGAEAGEDEAVVAVMQPRDHLPKHHLGTVGELVLLHAEDEGLVRLLLGILFEQFLIWLEDFCVEVAEALLQPTAHKRLAVQDEAVEDEVDGDLGAVGHGVHDELAVEDGVAVEGVLALTGREVAALNPPVIVLPVNEVVQLHALAIVGQVEKVADAVGFFADIVAITRDSGQPMGIVVVSRITGHPTSSAPQQRGNV